MFGRVCFLFVFIVVVVLSVFGSNRKITTVSSREHGKIHTPFMKDHWEKPSQWGRIKGVLSPKTASCFLRIQLNW